MDKDMIENEIVACLPLPRRGFLPTVPLAEMVNAILYKLKTGVHRCLLSVGALSWQSVYHHFRKWSVTGAWKDCWVELLGSHRSELDPSSVGLDGSHTTAIKGGERVESQGRKKRKATYAPYMADRKGLPLAMSEPMVGNHNDLFEIEVQFEVVTGTLEDAGACEEGLLMNAVAGLDSKEFRGACAKKDINANTCFNKRNRNTDGNEYFDQDLDDLRYAIERTNAWMYTFRSLLNRSDTTT